MQWCSEASEQQEEAGRQEAVQRWEEQTVDRIQRNWARVRVEGGDLHLHAPPAVRDSPQQSPARGRWVPSKAMKGCSPAVPDSPQQSPARPTKTVPSKDRPQKTNATCHATPGCRAKANQHKGGFVVRKEAGLGFAGFYCQALQRALQFHPASSYLTAFTEKRVREPASFLLLLDSLSCRTHGEVFLPMQYQQIRVLSRLLC